MSTTDAGTGLIRPAREEDVGLLPTVEAMAAARFRDVGLAELADRPPAPDDIYRPFLQCGGLFVATAPDDTAVGFIAVGTVDGEGYIDEISVLPGFGGKGLGRLLIAAAADSARLRNQTRLRLTTFRDVPWNGPWYRRCGFREMASSTIGPELAGILARQADLDNLSPRIAMERPLDS